MAAARSPRPSESAAAPLALSLERVEVEGMAVRVGHRGPDPGAGRRRGTAVVLTGRAEFIEKHEETVGDLAARGFAVAIFDWRGQGGSDRYRGIMHRGHVVEIEDYLKDLAAVLDHLERRRLPRPWLMLGHSMGGHIGLRHLVEGPPRFAGAMLTAPMFGIDLHPLPDALARAICAFAIRVGAGPRYAPGQRDFDPARLAYPRNKLTSCEVRFADLLRRVEAAPHLVVGGVTYHWLSASLRSMALVNAPGYVERIEVPVLVCQARDEWVVSNGAIAKVAGRLPRGRLLTFEGRHELLRERDPVRRQVLDAFAGLADELAVAALA